MRIFSSMVTDTPMRPSSSIMVVTSCRCGTFDTVTGPSDSRQAASMGKVAFFAPGNSDFALERYAAVNLQFIHGRGSRILPA